MERKLAAILYADCVGYSRHTGEDEEGTHVTLSTYLDDLTESIKAHGGKVSLLELTERICKWPIGHPGEVDFHFCGKPSVAAFPYCPEHCQQAYQVQQPRRDRRTNRGRISATPVR